MIRSVWGLLLGLCLAAPAHAEFAFVVDVNNNLFMVDLSRTPSSLNTALVGPLMGLAGSPTEQILGLDVRPSTGGLYALSDDGYLYLVDPATARVTTLHRFADGHLRQNIWGFDFDPRADRLRIVRRGEPLQLESYLIDPTTFAATLQGAITGLDPFESIVGLGYANNIAGATSSTLYAISSGNGFRRLSRIGAANDTTGASQAAGAATPIVNLGPLTLGIFSVGFDVSATGELFLVARIDNQNILYRIDLTAGAIQIFALEAAQLAEMRAFAIYSHRQKINVLTNDNKLVVIDSASPSVPAAGMPAAPVDFVGLRPGEQIMAIDVRPRTGELYGFTDQSRLYRIAPPVDAASTSAVATLVGSGPIAIPATSPRWEMDFDPLTDRLRLARVQPGVFFTVHPDTAALISSNIRNFDPVGLAFPMNMAPFTPSLFVLDATNGDLVIPTSTTAVAVQADASYLTLIGSNGFDASLVDNTVFYAANNFLESFTTLFTLNLRTAEIRALGPIFTRPTEPQVSVRGIAVASPGILRVVASATVGEADGTLSLDVDRVNGTNGPMSVNCLTTDESATRPADFGEGVRAQMLAGVSGGSCVVPIVNDTTIEASETFTVTLAYPFGGGPNISLAASTTVTIVDNDSATANLLPAVTITGPTAEPTFFAASTPLTVTGTADDLDGTIVSVQWATDGGASGAAVVTPTTPTAHVTWSANVPLHGGPNVVTVTARDNSGATGTDELTVTLPNTSRSYFLAEGATGGFFDYDLLLVNPTMNDASITITFLREGGTPVMRSETLPPQSRRTIRVDDIAGLENTAVSTIVTSIDGEPLVVERTMWWDATGYGAHTEKASEAQALQWYFAEGSQGFFQTYLLLANPQAFEISASVEYLREGAPAITRSYTMDAQQRLTVDAGADAALVGQSFGMVVTFSHPAAAERAMYFGGPPLFRAGHESAGVTAPSTTWFLAEGATGPFFETFVLLANPNTEAVSAEVTFLPSANPPVTRTVSVPGRGRHTINIEGVDASLANEAVATRITSSAPIVVERAQYWPDPAPQWYEAHNSFGVATLGTRWGLAEGRVGGPAAYQTYILLANPGPVDATATITFLPESGAPFVKTFTVPANRRFNVSTGPGTDVPELTNVNFGAVIASTQPIAVERALYASGAGQTWAAGTNATATRLPAAP